MARYRFTRDNNVPEGVTVACNTTGVVVGGRKPNKAVSIYNAEGGVYGTRHCKDRVRAINHQLEMGNLLIEKIVPMT